MQISQSALFRLCCASFGLGILSALFYDFLYMTRLWLIPPSQRYSLPTIQKLQTPRMKKRKRRKPRKNFPDSYQIALFLGDVFFCVVSALAMILLLYWLNNGAFRATAPLCMALGFGLWRTGVSKGVRIVFQWLAFAIETVIYTLSLPGKCLFNWIATTCRKSAQRRRNRCLKRQRENYTRQHLQNIDSTAKRFLQFDLKPRMQKGDKRAKAREKTV